MHVAARRDAAMQFSWLNASENRAHPTWRRWVTGVLALVMFVGPLSITFEQSRDAAGLLAAGSRRISDDAWAQAWEVMRAPMSLSLRLAINEAQASPITDPTAPISFQPRITQSTGAGGGVPVVNITAPNAAGISLNQYQNFNIDPVGLILNNSLMSGTSLTGGDVQANPNLAGRTASVIVNQVTSSGAAFASVLNGPLEVFGAPATVIVANPNGVSTRGMGVTNTIGVTLSTGTPQFLSDVNGAPTDFAAARAIGYDVRGGHIQVEGNTGVNGPGAGIEGTVGTIDLIGETIGVNAPLYAGTRINAIAGRQFVTPAAVGDAGTTYATSANGTVNTAGAINTANAQANSGLAIDATAYGAMTAGQIQVIGTAAGMGVRVNSQLASNVGDLTISANGDVSVAGTAAQGQASIQSGGNVALIGAHVGVHDYTIAANGDVGSAGTLQAGGKLAVTGGGQVSLANTISSGDTTIVAGAGATTGMVQSGGNLAITALGNSGAGTTGAETTGSGTIGDVTLNGATTVHGATSINAARDVTVNAAGTSTTLQATAQRNVNVGALLQTSGNMALSATSGNVTTAANIKSGGDLAVSAGSSIQNGGQTTAQNNAALAAGQNIAITGSIASGAALNAQAQRNVSVPGSMLAGTDATLTAGQGIDVGGVFIAQNNATIHAGADVTSSGSLAVGQNAAITAGHDIASTGKVLSNGLKVAADNTVLLTDVQAGGVASITAAGQAGAGDVTFNGKAALLGGTSITAARDIAVNGSVAGGAGVALSAQRNVSVAQGGQVQAIGGLNVSTVSGSVASNGSIDSGAGIAVSSAQDIVLAGSTTAKGDVSVRAGRDVSTSGSIAGQAGANVIAARDVNLGGNTGFSNDVSLQAGNDVNASGTLQGNNVTLTAAHSTTLNNVQANGALSVASTGSGVPGGGDVTVNGTVNGLSSGAVTAAHDVIVNTAGAIQTAGALTVSAAHDTNVSGTVQSNGDLAVSNQNGSLTSSGNIQSGANLTTTAAQGVTLAAGSTTGALGNVSVTAQDVALGGSLVAQGNGTVSAGNALSGAGSAAFGLAATLTSGADTNLSGSVRAGTVSLSAGGSANVQDVQGGSTVTLSATRDLQLNGALTGGAGVTLGAGGSVILPGSVQAAGDLSVSASTGSIATSGVIGTSGAFAAVAGTDISLGGTTSAALSTSLTATRDVSVVGTLNGLAAATLSAGRDIAGAGTLTFMQAATLDAGRDIAQGSLVQGQSVQAHAGNSASFNNISSASTINLQADGSVPAGSPMTTPGGDVSIAGNALANGAVTLTATRDATVAGKLSSRTTVGIAAQGDIDVSGAVESVDAMSLTAQGNLNATGAVTSGSTLSVTTGLDLNAGGATSSVGAMTLNAGRDAFLNGVIVSEAGATFSASRDLLGSGTQVIAQDLGLSADRNIGLTGSMQANQVAATAGNNASLNSVTSGSSLSIAANGQAGGGDASITGTAAAPGAVNVTATRDVSVSGSLTGGPDVTLSAGHNGTIGGAVQSVGDLSLTAQSGNVSVSGSTLSNGATTLSAAQDVVVSGKVGAGTDLNISTQTGNVSVGGSATSNGATTITSAGDANVGATLASGTTLNMTARGNIGVAGAIQSTGTMTLAAQGNLNATGGINSGAALNVSTGQDLILGASTSAVGALTLNAGRDATLNGVTVGEAGATITAGRDLLGGGTQAITQDAILNAGRNVALGGALQANSVSATGGNDAALNTVTSATTLAITANGNAGTGDAAITGTATAPGTITLTAARDASVSGALTGGQTVTLSGQRDTSITGTVQSVGDFRLAAKTGNLSVTGAAITNGVFNASSGQDTTIAGQVSAAGSATVQAGRDIALAGVLAGQQSGTLSAVRDVTGAGSAAFAQAATVNAGRDVALSGALQGATVAVTGGNNAQLGAVQAVSGNLSVFANGGQGGGDVTVLSNATALGNVALTSSRDTTVSGALNAGGTTVVDATRNASLASINSAGDLTVSARTGNVSAAALTTQTNLLVSAAGTLSVAGATTVGGSATLASGSNTSLGTLGVQNAASLSAGGNLTAASIAAGQQATLTAGNTIGVAGAVATNGALAATAGGSLALGSAQAGTTLALTTTGHSAPGDITVAGSSVSGGATTITSVRDASIGGPITSLSTVNVSAGRNLGTGSSISSNSTTSLLAQTGNVSVAGAITSGGDLTARAGGAIGLNSALVNGNTTLNAQGNIVAAGPLFGLGAATINAGTQANLGALTFVRDINVTAGAGINTGAVQTVGNFQATANGDIGLGSTTAVGNLGATSYGGSVTFNGAATSGGNLTVNAANSVVAGSGLASAGNVTVNGANGNVVVNNVSANGDASLHAGQTLAMGGNTTVVGQVGLSGANVGLTGTLSGSKSVGISAAGTLDAGGATIVSTQNTTLSGANVTVGNVIAGGSLNATASNQLTLAGSQVAVVSNATLVSGNGFYNASQVLSGGALFVSAPNLINAAGASLASTSTTTLNASNLVNAGLVNGASTAVNVGGTLTNVGGSLMGLNALAINTGALNNQSGLIFAGNPNVPGGPTTGDLSLTINGGDGSMVNGGGQLLAQRNFTLSAVNQTLDLSQQGTISQGGQLSITAAAISNSGTWNYGGQGASIYGVNGVTNTGTITGSSPLTISTQGVFTNAGQVIGSDVTVNGAISNVAGALLHADNNFTINGDTTNRGTVEAGNTLTVNGGNYDNAGATTQSQRDINFNLGGTLQNTGGSIFAGNNIAIHAGAVVNDQTAPTGQQTTTQTVSDPALLLSGSLGTLTSSTLAGSLDHSHAVYSTSDAAISALLTSGQAAGTTVTLDQLSDGNWYVDGPSSQAAMQNGGLSRVAQKTIALPSVTQTVTTQTPGTSGVISAGNGIQITASSLSNRGGQIAAGGDISLNVASLSNGSVSPTVQTAGGERVDAAQYSAFLGALASLGTIAIGESVNPNNDRYVAPTTFTINTGSGAPTAASSATWSSPTGMIAAGHDMNITGGSLVNAGLLYAGNNVNISGASVTNQGGNQQNSSTQTGCASGVPSSACGTGGQTRGGNPTTTTFGYNQNDATIYAGNNLVIAAGQINNTFGNLIAGHDLVIGGVGSSASSTTPAGSLNNTSGNIIAGNNITLNVAGAITNTLPPPVPVHENYGSNEQYSGCMTAGGYKESYCEGYVDQQSGSSSVISAGNNLNINAGSLTNIGSLISAGNTATISVLGPVINEAQTLNAYWHSHWVQETGMFSADKRNDVWACGTVAECQTLYGSAYTGTGSIDPPTPVGNIAATIQAPNLSISSNGQIQNIGNIIGTSVSLTGATLVNGITSANTYTPRVNEPSQVISLSPVNLPGLNISTPRSVGGALPTPVVGKASYVDGQIAVSNGLGPQTLIDNLPASLQPSTTLFYYNPQEENLLLQQAALQQTGKASFVDGLSYDSQQGASVTDQEKAYLYGNAVAYAEANNLKLGDALSQTQISALDKPMLWYVEQTVPDPSCTAVGTATCPTITALMPQVYLPQNNSAMAAGGNIVGQDVTLNFNQGGQGSILNTGTISASGTLAINTNSLTNQANQVNVGDIWSSVKGGYVDTTGTVVQPGGFMSAANMDLNVQTLQQVGGALQKLNSDGTVDQAGTQQVLAQLQQQLGMSFTQTSVQDDLHTTFVKAGGMDPLMVIGMAVAVAVSVELGPEMFAFYNGIIDPIALAAISPTLAVLGSAAATGLAVGSTALVAGAASQLISTGGINLGQDLKGAAVSALTAGVTQGLLGSTGITNLGNGVTQASSGTTLANVGVTAQNVGAQALIGATSQTLINGGSFGQALIASAANDAAAVGANAIGSTFNGSSWALSTNNPAYVLAHGLLGCAAGAASGSGCGGGAIGGATSAALAGYLVSQAGGAANLTTDQRAVIVAAAMLAGGALAGAAGQNAIGGASAAENEALNNATGDRRTEEEKAEDAVRADMAKQRAMLGEQSGGITSANGTPTVSTSSLNAGLGGATSNVKLVEQDGNIYQFSIPAANGDLSVVTEMTQSGNQLILNGMHIDGPGAGASSVSQLRNIARALGQQYGVDEVVINGGTRTSGASPGKVPRSITIKVN
jgi:filamentous hemagglutinin